jgi:hypothetical protein
LKKNSNAKRKFCPLTFEVCDASFVSLIKMLRLLTSNCSALLHLFSQRGAYGSRFSVPAARRDSKKIHSLKAQGAAKKGCGKVSWEKCCRAHFFLGPVRAYRNPLPAAKKVRAIEIAIAILPHKMCSSHSCFVQSSPQRLIKATYPPRPQGTKALETRKGGPGMCCCIYFLLSA